MIRDERKGIGGRKESAKKGGGESDKDFGSELELELIQSHMAQKPMLRGEVGCARVAREVSVEKLNDVWG